MSDKDENKVPKPTDDDSRSEREHQAALEAAQKLPELLFDREDAPKDKPEEPSP